MSEAKFSEAFISTTCKLACIDIPEDWISALTSEAAPETFATEPAVIERVVFASSEISSDAAAVVSLTVMENAFDAPLAKLFRELISLSAITAVIEPFVSASHSLISDTVNDPSLDKSTLIVGKLTLLKFSKYFLICSVVNVLGSSFCPELTCDFAFENVTPSVISRFEIEVFCAVNTATAALESVKVMEFSPVAFIIALSVVESDRSTSTVFPAELMFEVIVDAKVFVALSAFSVPPTASIKFATWTPALRTSRFSSAIGSRFKISSPDRLNAFCTLETAKDKSVPWSTKT